MTAIDKPSEITRSEITRLGSGRAQIVADMGGGWDNYQRIVKRTGIYALTAFIADVLETNYPATVFGDGTNLYPTWASEHGGTDIEPGVKWVALLCQAVREVEG